MITVKFKTSSGASEVSFSAFKVVPLSHEEATEFTDINNRRWRLVQAVYKRFEITFAYLSETQQDYLNALTQYSAPEFVYNSIAYAITIEGQPNLRALGAKLTVTSQVPE